MGRRPLPGHPAPGTPASAGSPCTCPSATSAVTGTPRSPVARRTAVFPVAQQVVTGHGDARGRQPGQGRRSTATPSTRPDRGHTWPAPSATPSSRRVRGAPGPPAQPVIHVDVHGSAVHREPPAQPGRMSTASPPPPAAARPTHGRTQTRQRLERGEEGMANRANGELSPSVRSQAGSQVATREDGPGRAGRRGCRGRELA